MKYIHQERQEIYASVQPWTGNTVQLWLYERTLENGETINVMRALPVTFEKQDDFTQSPPTIELQPSAAQLLMNELWRVGLRPTQSNEGAGALGATEKHLADMRTIVFSYIKTDHK